MSPSPFNDTVIRVSSLSHSGQNAFEIVPDSEVRAQIAQALEAQTLRKLRLSGTISPMGSDGWKLRARLGATAVQSCIVTLDPVTTRIDTEFVRSFLPPHRLDDPEAGSEIEMPEDDSTEPLGETIDLLAILTEALAIALPDYPRNDQSTLDQTQFAPEGVTPLDDEMIKPFAALAGLREKMSDKDNES